jgi:hypothetical protein
MMFKHHCIFACAILATLSTPGYAVDADETRSTLQDQQEVAVNNAFESAYEIVLKNAKKQRVTVTVQEPIPADWKILNASHFSEKAISNTAGWHVEVPAEGKTMHSYCVQVKY